VRPWLAVPIVGVVAGAIAAGLGVRGLELACAAMAAAAIVQALRALAGEEPAALAAAAVGGLFAVVAIAEHGALARAHVAVPWLAVAAAGWTFAELARPTATPYVALAPAIAAAILDPACVALPAIAGARLVRPSREVLEAALRAQLRGDAAPQPIKQRGSGQLPLPIKAPPRPARPGVPPRWVIAVPIAGALLVVLAIVAGAARDGALASLASSWFGPRVRDTAPLASLAGLGDALGPLAVVAVVGGVAVLARVHLASLAIVACAAGALLVDLRAGVPGATTLGLAALCAGAGVARLAGTIRLRSGQAIAAATFGAMLLVPPVWTVIG